MHGPMSPPQIPKGTEEDAQRDRAVVTCRWPRFEPWFPQTLPRDHFWVWPKTEEWEKEGNKSTGMKSRGVATPKYP